VAARGEGTDLTRLSKYLDRVVRVGDGRLAHASSPSYSMQSATRRAAV
jgi:hypothetical protein